MVALGCTAQARVVYVTPTGAGNMDGTSWENAYASVEVAYADVGLDAAGGTVCIAGGTYLVSAPMSMRPNVAVVGGFGGETILSGDKGYADTWKRNNDGTDYEKYSLGTVCAIFDENGALVLPAPAAEDEFWTPYDPTYSSDPNTGFCFTNVAENAENATFANLTFACFGYGAIYSTSGLADGLVVTNCRFVANNSQADRCASTTPATVYIANSAAKVLDSKFAGNNFGLRFHSDSRVVTNLVCGCAFTHNNALRQENIHGGAGGCEEEGRSRRTGPLQRRPRRTCLVRKQLRLQRQLHKESVFLRRRRPAQSCHDQCRCLRRLPFHQQLLEAERQHPWLGLHRVGFRIAQLRHALRPRHTLRRERHVQRLRWRGDLSLQLRMDGLLWFPRLFLELHLP